MERNLGDIGLADTHCGAALTLSMSVHGPQHPATIDATRQLAAIRVDEGRLGEAGRAYQASRAWLVAHLGPLHDSVAKDDNSLAIIAWERGDIAAALSALDQAIAIRRLRHNPTDLAAVLFNKAMVLQDAGRARDARPLLLEARKLRADRLGAANPLVGDTDRLLGEVDAALGNRQARGELLHAVQSTRAGYGPDHPHTRRAELSLAWFDASHGDIGAMARLDALSRLSRHDVELRKVAWLASADAAGLRCRGTQRPAALATLQGLREDIAVAQPEGGVVGRKIGAVRGACG
jgi:serine/threonine-protein kinase